MIKDMGKEKKWLITFENGYPGCTLEEEFEGTREEAKMYAEDSLEDYAQTWTHIAFGWDEDFTEEEYEDYRADCGYTITPYEEEEEEDE